MQPIVQPGKFDEVTLDCRETIRDGVAGSRLRFPSDTSHLAMRERAEAYTALVRHFLA